MLHGVYYPTGDWTGTPYAERDDTTIDFYGELGSAPTDPLWTGAIISVRWTGIFVAPFSENYAFSVIANNGAKIWIEDELVFDSDGPTGTAGGFSKALEGGRGYSIRIDYTNFFEPVAQMQIRWQSESLSQRAFPGQDGICNHGRGREISDEFEDYLAQPQQERCYLWLIEPKGKPAEAYTSWDDDIVYDVGPRPGRPEGGELTFSSLSGVAPTEIPAGIGLSVDSTDLTALLQLGGVTKAKIMTGYYRDAIATIYLVTPEHLEYGHSILAAGLLNGCEVDDETHAATFELTTWGELLSRPLGRVTSLICPWRFMRGHCRNNIDGFGAEDPTAPDDGPKPGDPGRVLSGTLATVHSRSHLKISGISAGAAPNDFANFGLLRITSGEFEGAEFEIKKWKSDGDVRLALSTQFLLEAGVSVEVEEGCEGTFAACKSKGNTINFGGQNNLPPEEVLAKVSKKEKDDKKKEEKDD